MTPQPNAQARNAAGGGSGFWIPLAMLGILLLILLGLMAWAGMTGQRLDLGLRRGPARLPIIGTVPEFSLVDTEGRSITREDFRGRLWVVDFIFTRCGGTCPQMSSRMSGLSTALAGFTQLAPPPIAVSISVDPEWDTPDVLKRYGEAYGARPGRWMLLTGRREAIQRLARDGFRLGVQEGMESEVEPIIHSQSFVLVDAQGRIRGYYDGTDPQAIYRLLADLALLQRKG